MNLEYSSNKRLKEIKRKSFMNFIKKFFVITSIFVILIICVINYKIIYSFTLDRIADIINYKLEKIEVIGNEYLDKNEIIALSKINQYDNLLKIDRAKIIDNLLKNKIIKRADIKRELPNKVIIQIAEKKPIYFVMFGNSKKILSEDMNLFECNLKNKYLDLPYITFSENYKIKNENELKNEIESKKDLLLALKDTFDKTRENDISEVHIDNYTNKLYLKNGYVVLFKSVEYDKLLLTYEIIKKGIENKIIDLRFKNMIIGRAS